MWQKHASNAYCIYLHFSDDWYTHRITEGKLNCSMMREITPLNPINSKTIAVTRFTYVRDVCRFCFHIHNYCESLNRRPPLRKSSLVTDNQRYQLRNMELFSEGVGFYFRTLQRRIITFGDFPQWDLWPFWQNLLCPKLVLCDFIQKQ
jgi:hypothetical protein